MTNLTVSTDHFVRVLATCRTKSLEALRSAGALRLGFLDCDGGFAL